MVGLDIADADAYATAAFAMGTAGVAWVEGVPGHEAFAVDPAGARSWTSGFPGYAAA